MTRSAFLLPDSPLYPFTTSSFQHFFFLLSAYRDRCVLHTCFNRPNQYLLRHLWILVADSTIWSGEMAEKQTESSTIEGELIIVVRSSSFGASCHYSSFPQQSLFLSSPFRQPSTVLSNRWETCTFGLSMLFFNTFLRKNDNTFFIQSTQFPIDRQFPLSLTKHHLWTLVWTLMDLLHCNEVNQNDLSLPRVARKSQQGKYRFAA